MMGGMAPDERVDIMEFGGSPGRRRWLRWLPPVVLVAAVAALVVHGTHRAAPPPAASASPTVGAPSPDPSTTDVARPLLGATGGWELFGRGPSGVVRVEPAHGRVTRTAVPPLDSSGPVSFVAGPDWTIVRPLDFVPGYLVPDGQRARRLTGALSQGGVALPSTDPAKVWMANGVNDYTTMTLVDLTGKPGSSPIGFDAGLGIEPDGAGNALLIGSTGVYAAGPDGVRRVTTGTLLAIGPGRWLLRECADPNRCEAILVDSRTGARRAVGEAPDPPAGPPGSITPDGATAALFHRGTAGMSVHLIDLASGTDRVLEVPVDQPYDGGLAWSPEGRWLFVAGADGRLYPVEAATGQVHDLGVPLPPLEQLAVRAPAG